VKKPVAIVDYGMGNLWSVRNALVELGAESELVAEPEALERFEKIILPGVGAFADAMRLLRDTGLDRALDARRAAAGVEILGVCLGMQLMCTRSFEDGEHQGLGWIEAEVRPLTPAPGLKIPHMGWNSVRFTRSSPLVAGIESGTDFYFVHGYHVVCADSSDVLGTCEHGQTVAAVLERGNLRAAQFHPEKSQRGGLTLLRNFVENV
jgi:glutamine amidotransferase